MEMTMPVALVPGASRGLGRALAEQLSARGWTLVVDARDAAALGRAMAGLDAGDVPLVPGGVGDAAHPDELARARPRRGAAGPPGTTTRRADPPPHPPPA